MPEMLGCSAEQCSVREVTATAVAKVRVKNPMLFNKVVLFVWIFRKIKFQEGFSFFENGVGVLSDGRFITAPE